MPIQWLSRLLGSRDHRRGRRVRSQRREARQQTERFGPADPLVGVSPEPRFAPPPRPVTSMPASRAASSVGPPLVPPPVATRGSAALAEPEATRIDPQGGAPRGGVVGVLIGLEGKYEGQVYAVGDGVNLLGRARDARIALGSRDDTVSREHAEIVHQDGQFALKSLRPNNPTWINDEEVGAGSPLADGDRIRVGQTTFRFRKA